jgi:hypothetical protein
MNAIETLKKFVKLALSTRCSLAILARWLGVTPGCFFQETVDANSEHDLSFQEWMKKADEAAHNKRQKLARELADTQAQSHAVTQD